MMKTLGSSLSETAYARIKQDIVEIALRPGTELSEARLADRYGLGKAPIRTALLRLRQDGLVTVVPRRGYRVATIALQDIHDIFELRLLLEPAAARAAAGHVDGKKLRRLDSLCRAGYRLDNPKSLAAFLRANKEFHVTIARASGNKWLARTLADVLDHMERLFRLGLAVRNRTPQMQHEHRALVDALMAGDAASASQLTSEQIHAAEGMVNEAIFSKANVQALGVSAEVQLVG